MEEQTSHEDVRTDETPVSYEQMLQELRVSSLLPFTEISDRKLFTYTYNLNMRRAFFGMPYIDLHHFDRKYSDPEDPETIVESIKKMEIQPKSGDNRCNICLNSVQDDIQVVTPCCYSLFCSDCLVNSIKVKNWCPICRQDEFDISEVAKSQEI